MTYRNDKDAQDEQTRARIVRIRGELHALEAQIGAPPSARHGRWTWLLAGVALGATVASVAFGALLVGGRLLAPATPEGAPDAPRAQPDRRELDIELMRLHGEMQGCAPSAFNGPVQADVTFAGASGAIIDVSVVNHGDTTLDHGMVTCIEQTFARLGTPRFRASTYLYRNTLEWRNGTLLPEPLGALDGL
jgi:hypothetical protein